MAVSHGQSFLLGVTAALSTVFIVHKIQEHRRLASLNPSRTSRKNRETSSSSSSTTAPPSAHSPLLDAPDLDLRLIRKAEAVIQGRTDGITLVVERCTNDHNYSAILRTAEALGIQHVWIIDPPAWTDVDGAATITDSNKTGIKLTPEELEQRQQHRLFAQNATEWLTLREFATTSECLAALRESDHQIWATDLSQVAVSLTPDGLQESNNWPLPNKLAIVFGTEAVGCSQEMLDACDLRVYLPLRGFADSLNLSVATALIIHQLFVLQPDLVGDMSEETRRAMRQAWFSKLALQRLLSSSEKKRRNKLLTQIDNCRRLQVKVDAGQELSESQATKVMKLPELQTSLEELEARAAYSSKAAEQAVADFVINPPAPLTDLRRADLHRVSFVGKNTKRNNAENWKDMPATSNPPSLEKSTASFFRERIASITATETK
jgi:tRNA G18 (ribose-2'-O)-methylase SpoU